MTSTERTAIEKLRDEVHGYHCELKEFVAVLNATREDVASIKLDVHGIPGKPEECPGLMGDVADLKRSRTLQRYALRGVWALLTILFGTAATALVTKFWHA